MARLAQSLLSGACILLLLASVHASTNICFEKLSDVPAIYLTEHPAGNALAVGTQDGLIKLLVRPKSRSGTKATNYSTFLDLTDRVQFSGEQGLLSFAFHPSFLTNGRFFVSYICDSTVHPDCAAPCACTAARGCTGAPARCPYSAVVAEYSAGPDPTNAVSLNTTEVRKVIVFGRPSASNNGGHIFFGSDGLLYVSSGDGSSSDMPLTSAQNGAVPLGKILRVSVDAPSMNATHGYAVPTTNPFVNTSGVMPEVYALGFRNPWRCSQDPVTGNIFCGDIGKDPVTGSIFCGDIGKAAIQEVDQVAPGGNYGWPYMEGFVQVKDGAPAQPMGGSFSAPSIAYDLPPIDNGQAVIGGYVYRARRNACLQGRYIYGDGNAMMFIGTLGASNMSVENVTYSIAPDSAGQTVSKEGLVVSIPFPEDDKLYSWGVDDAQELYRLSSSGIYRVTDVSVCGFPCNGDIQVFHIPTPSHTNPDEYAGSRAGHTLNTAFWALGAVLAVLLLRW